MTKFSDFGIKPKSVPFEGDKIKIDNIINKDIIVERFKIGDSKYDNGNKSCLCIQLKIKDERRILFTGSKNLIDMIQRVDENKFPFQSTIVKESNQLTFI